MKHLAAALCLFASPLLAQITPLDVLASWQQFSNRHETGFTFARQEGDAAEITLYDVTLIGSIPVVLPWVKLTANSGGEVEISTVEILAWEAPILAVFPDSTTKGTAHLAGLTIQASGTPNDVRYDFVIENFSSDTTDDYREKMDVNTLSLSGLSGTLTHHWDRDTGDVFGATMSADLWEANTDSTIRGEDAGQQHDSLTNVSMAFEAALSQLDHSTVSFDSGALVRRVAYGSDFLTEITAGSTAFSGSGNLANPFLRVHLTDATMTHRSDSRTFPDLNMQYDILLLDASASNRTAGAHYPWQIEARLEGLELSPETWAMIDPTTALPHSPSHFTAKLNGIGKRLEDGAEIGPFLWLPEMRALALETLDVNFGGLMILASGAVSFQEDTASLYALPTPNGGQIILRMQGAQMLLNALETGPISALFPSHILSIPTPAGQSPNNLDVQILFDEQGGISVE